MEMHKSQGSDCTCKQSNHVYCAFIRVLTTPPRSVLRARLAALSAAAPRRSWPQRSVATASEWLVCRSCGAVSRQEAAEGKRSQ